MQLLFLSKGFSNGPSPPLGAHVQRPSRSHEQKQRPKLGIFNDKQGATSAESLLKRATVHESLRTTVLSQGFSNFFVPRPISKKFFLGDPLMDSLMLMIRVNVTLVYRNIYI